MKFQFLFAAWLAFSIPAYADLYRCEVGGKTLYQDTQCPAGHRLKIILKQPEKPKPPTTRLNPNATYPTAEDHDESRLRAQRDIAAAREIEQRKERDHERDRLDRQADADRAAAVTIANEANMRRCKLMEIEVQRLETEARHGFSGTWQSKRAEDARARYRVLCP